MKLKCLYLIFILCGTPVLASENWEFSGQLRHRFEMIDKDFDNETESNNLNFFRTRFNVKFSLDKGSSVFFQLQDSRLFGEEENTLTDGTADRFDLHQGYLFVQELFGLPLDLKLGRMEVNYGSQRLIGAVGWHNIGRSFDGGILSFHSKYVSLDAFYFKIEEAAEINDEGDVNFLGLYSDWHLKSNVTSQLYIVWQREKPLQDLNRYTAGFFIKGKHGGFHQTIEAAYQGGTVAELDVAAYLACLEVGYHLKDLPGQPDLIVGVDYVSGDDDDEDDEYQAFDTLYATNHKFYGYMDYFLNLPAATDNRGLTDLYFRVRLKPVTPISVDVTYHLFQSSEDYQLDAGKTSDRYGNEIDFNLAYSYSKVITFTAGGGLFMPSEIFEETKGEDMSTWLYLMTLVKF